MSFKSVRRRIERRIRILKSSIDSHYPPQMGGTNALDFEGDANDMKAAVDEILIDPYFSGVAPSLVALPPAGELIDSCMVLEASARALTGIASPTQAQKQQAADEYFTLGSQASSLISTYTV